MEHRHDPRVIALRQPTAPALRPPPHNYEAEQALLGAIFASNRVYGHVADRLQPDDFADPLHGRIYAKAGRLIERGEIANFLTLRDQFDNDPALAEAGGAKYIARLENSVVTIVNVESYARTIRDLADRRRLLVLCEEAIEAACNVDIDVPTTNVAAALVAQLQREVRGADDGLTTADDIAERIVSGLGKELPCSPTGLRRLDHVLAGGLYGGKFYGIAAKYKAGKSLLMGTMAHNLTLAGVPTLYLSLEMGPDEIVQRMLARLMGVNSLTFLGGTRRSPEFQMRAAQAAIDLAKRGCLILARRPRMTLDDVLATIATAALRRGIKGAFVDYLQLVTGRPRNENLAAHYDNVAQALAELTKRFGIWIVAGAQTNRDDTGIRHGDGLLNAGDMILNVRKVEMIGAPDQVWLEMAASRYTPREDVGSKDGPAFEIDTAVGPAFREL